MSGASSVPRGAHPQEPAHLHPSAGTSSPEAQTPFPAVPWERNPPASAALVCTPLMIIQFCMLYAGCYVRGAGCWVLGQILPVDASNDLPGAGSH